MPDQPTPSADHLELKLLELLATGTPGSRMRVVAFVVRAAEDAAAEQARRAERERWEWASILHETVKGKLGDGFPCADPSSMVERAAEEIERLRVQLAGCLAAAEGHEPRAVSGDYGWSPAYEAVWIVRDRITALVAGLRECADAADRYEEKPLDQRRPRVVAQDQSRRRCLRRSPPPPRPGAA